MTSTVDTLAPILKKTYEALSKEPLYTNKPLLSLIPKNTAFVGETCEVPLRYSNEPGGSATFARALANKGYSRFQRFSVTRRKDYAIGAISTELLRAAAGGSESARSAVIDSTTAVLRGLRNTCERSLARAAYGAGGGWRAQVASGMASSTITLANPEDVVWFEVGMQLDGSATDGLSGSATVGGAASVITAINRTVGTLTNDGSANWNAVTGISGLAANWYLFRGGDFGATLVGVDGWIPETVTVTPFFGVNRTVDEERLAGSRITPSTTGYTYSTIEGGILALLSRVYRAGGAPDHFFLHPQRFRRLAEELGAKVVYNDAKSPAGVSFSAIVVHGQGGPCKVISDPCCPKDVGFALQLDTWKLRTLGEPMSIVDDDGQKPWLREANEDAVQIRLATYGNFTCSAPAFNGRCSFAGIA